MALLFKSAPWTCPIKLSFIIVMASQNRLDPLTAFMTVAQTGGFSAAARRMGVSPPAVSQAVRALEDRLGVPLFVRTTRSVGLTEAGHRLQMRCGPALEELQRALSDVGDLGENPAGFLRLNVPGVAVPLVIAPLLAPFREAYPNIEIEIAVDDGLADIIAERFDAGIRADTLVDKDMVSVKLTPPFKWCIVASPLYAERRGLPQTPEELSDHDCLKWRMQTSGAVYTDWHVIADGKDVRIPTNGTFTVNDPELLHRAARDGMGLAYTLEPSVARDLEKGRLVPVLQAHWPSEPGLCLYFPQGAQKLAKLRAFIDFARANLMAGANRNGAQRPQ